MRSRRWWCGRRGRMRRPKRWAETGWLPALWAEPRTRAELCRVRLRIAVDRPGRGCTRRWRELSAAGTVPGADQCHHQSQLEQKQLPASGRVHGSRKCRIRVGVGGDNDDARDPAGHTPPRGVTHRRGPLVALRRWLRVPSNLPKVQGWGVNFLSKRVS